MDSAKLDKLERVAKALKGWPQSYIRFVNFQETASPNAILEMVRELRVLRRVLEFAAATLCSPDETMAAWRAEAEQELGEK